MFVWIKPVYGLLLVGWLCVKPLHALDTSPAFEPLKTVIAYTDALIEHGRDSYGSETSPLFATTLDRANLRLFPVQEIAALQAIPRESWGIRSTDRMLTGANPMHDENLYQVLYALTDITGNQRYAAEADNTLRWFFEHCQSPVTGLMAWGEHIGWDFYTETIIDSRMGTTHEFYRPWVLWDRSYAVAPEACTRFAKGVWEHQIGDPSSGNFSRHAKWDRHEPHTNSEYPRHGGFYIATWAKAFQQTRDPVFIDAIQTLLNYFERRRNPYSGAIPAESHERSQGKMMWPPSNLSLAIDLWDGAENVPEPLATAMRDSAAKTDRVFLALPHDLDPGGRGFIRTAGTEQLDVISDSDAWRGYSRRWETGYGEQTDAVIANLCLLRYRQIHDDRYKQLIEASARRYLTDEPGTDFPLYPGTFGDVVWHLLGAYELTQDAQYLARAEFFARKAVSLFWPDASPLPRATNQHDHYEAVTRADTLAMALLQLWCVQNRPDISLSLIYSDR